MQTGVSRWLAHATKMAIRRMVFVVFLLLAFVGSVLALVSACDSEISYSPIHIMNGRFSGKWENDEANRDGFRDWPEIEFVLKHIESPPSVGSNGVIPIRDGVIAQGYLIIDEKKFDFNLEIQNAQFLIRSKPLNSVLTLNAFPAKKKNDTLYLYSPSGRALRYVRVRS